MTKMVYIIIMIVLSGLSYLCPIFLAKLTYYVGVKFALGHIIGGVELLTKIA